MSGPIVRKYGFPNFEKIFGERPLQHGVDETGHPDMPSKKSAEKKGEPKAKAAKPKSSKSKKS
jgi:hypothetical protein